MIEMPRLEGQNLSFALKIMERNHLKLGDTIYRTDFMLGSVLEQQYNGIRIPEKTKIQWGSRITLIIGGGLENKLMSVPNLIGMTYMEAKSILDESGIGLGAIIVDGALSDTSSAYVIQQRPERLDADGMQLTIRSGQLMDIWISQNMRIVIDTASTKKNNIP
jgi:beta-lactam-binding protein with PASTA domain